MNTASHHHQAPPRHLSQVQVRRLTMARPTARRVTIALDAFPDWPTRSTLNASNADFWEAKAREHIVSLQAALVLHKQLTSGTTVPTSLGYALCAMQVEIGHRIRRAIKQHTANGGMKGDELRQAWGQVA